VDYDSYKDIMQNILMVRWPGLKKATPEYHREVMYPPLATFPTTVVRQVAVEMARDEARKFAPSANEIRKACLAAQGRNKGRLESRAIPHCHYCSDSGYMSVFVACDKDGTLTWEGIWHHMDLEGVSGVQARNVALPCGCEWTPYDAPRLPQDLQQRVRQVIDDFQDMLMGKYPVQSIQDAAKAEAPAPPPIDDDDIPF